MRSIIALAILPCILATLLAVEIVLPAMPPIALPTPVASRPKPSARPAADADVMVDDLVAIVLDRPVMEPNRRARGVVPVAPPTDAALPRLSGVIIGPDGKRAIFTPATGRSLILAEGDKVGQAIIKTIRPDEVILAGSDGDQVIHLRHSNIAPTKGAQRNGSGK